MCWENPIRSVGPKGNHDRESHSVGWRLRRGLPRKTPQRAHAIQRMLSRFEPVSGSHSEPGIAREE